MGLGGRRILFGPGSIHVAHTDEERIAKRELLAAIADVSNLSEAIITEVSDE